MDAGSISATTSPRPTPRARNSAASRSAIAIQSAKDTRRSPSTYASRSPNATTAASMSGRIVGNSPVRAGPGSRISCSSGVERQAATLVTGELRVAALDEGRDALGHVVGLGLHLHRYRLQQGRLLAPSVGRGVQQPLGERDGAGGGAGQLPGQGLRRGAELVGRGPARY